MAAGGAPGWVRPLVDFGALLAFVGSFVAWRVSGVDQSDALVNATWVLMGGSIAAVITGRLAEGRWATMPMVTGGFAIVFGLFTVLFDDPEIIKLQITVMNGLLCAFLLGGLAMGRSPAKWLLGGSIELSDRVWRILAFRYGLYFAACAIANELVRRGWDEDVYVGFRSVLWVAAILFGLANLPLILKDRKAQGA